MGGDSVIRNGSHPQGMLGVIVSLESCLMALNSSTGFGVLGSSRCRVVGALVVVALCRVLLGLIRSLCREVISIALMRVSPCIFVYHLEICNPMVHAG